MSPQVMSVPVVRLRWSCAIACSADSASGAPLVPPRGGVFELLLASTAGIERAYVGQSDDLSRAYLAHATGELDDEKLRRERASNGLYFRYWEQQSAKRRREVVSALCELHFYDSGHDERATDTGCIRLVESEDAK